MFFCCPPGIFPSAQGCRRPKWPTNPVFRDCPPVGVRSAKAQTVKKLRNFGENFLERPYFSLKSASSTGKLRFSVFRPEFLQVPRAVLGQNGQRPSISQFPAPGGSRLAKWTTQNSSATLGRNFRGGRIFSPEGPLAPRKCIFVFSARAQNFSFSAQGQNRPKYH